MLGVTTALIGHEVRAYVEREFCGVGRSAGENSVDIYLVAFAGSLDRALIVGVVPVVGHKAVVINCKQTILLIPDEFALSNAAVPMASYAWSRLIYIIILLF